MGSGARENPRILRKSITNNAHIIILRIYSIPWMETLQERLNKPRWYTGIEHIIYHRHHRDLDVVSRLKGVRVGLQYTLARDSHPVRMWRAVRDRPNHILAISLFNVHDVSLDSVGYLDTVAWSDGRRHVQWRL